MTFNVIVKYSRKKDDVEDYDLKELHCNEKILK